MSLQEVHLLTTFHHVTLIPIATILLLCLILFSPCIFWALLFWLQKNSRYTWVLKKGKTNGVSGSCTLSSILLISPLWFPSLVPQESWACLIPRACQSLLGYFGIPSQGQFFWIFISWYRQILDSCHLFKVGWAKTQTPQTFQECYFIVVVHK